MKAIDRLKRDHKILRSKLDVIEAALRMGPSSTWYVLRELCYTLSCQIKDHLRREERLVAACRHAMTPEALAHIELEHTDEPQILRGINLLFIEQGGKAMEGVAAMLRDLVPRMRHHMDEEEAELFPVIERILGAVEDEPREQAVESHVGLRADMTINHVLAEHDITRRVFEQLFISVALEGADCLDEVAWRHGLQTWQLLQRLEQAIAPPARPSGLLVGRK